MDQLPSPFSITEGTINLAENPLGSACSRHIGVHHHFLKEFAAKQTVKVVNSGKRRNTQIMATNALEQVLLWLDEIFYWTVNGVLIAECLEVFALESDSPEGHGRDASMLHQGECYI